MNDADREAFYRQDQRRWKRRMDRERQARRRARLREERKTARANEARFIAGAYRQAVLYWSRLVYQKGGCIPW